MNTFKISPPCHPTARLMVEMRWEGDGWMEVEVPDGFWCDAPGCYNSWDVYGNPV